MCRLFGIIFNWVLGFLIDLYSQNTGKTIKILILGYILTTAQYCVWRKLTAPHFLSLIVCCIDEALFFLTIMFLFVRFNHTEPVSYAASENNQVNSLFPWLQWPAVIGLVRFIKETKQNEIFFLSHECFVPPMILRKVKGQSHSTSILCVKNDTGMLSVCLMCSWVSPEWQGGGDM